MRLYPTIKLKPRGVTNFALKSEGVRDGFTVSIGSSTGQSWSGTARRLNAQSARLTVTAAAFDLDAKGLLVGDIVDIDITVTNPNDPRDTETISLFAELDL